jgi:hypothetical protein
MALVRGFGWKVLSEDITHVDLRNGEIINFASPFAVKRGTISHLQKTLDDSGLRLDWSSFDPNSDSPITWIPLGTHSLGNNLKAPFDLVVYFDGFTDGDATCKKLPSAEFVRAILQISNFTRLDDATSKICEYVAEERCYRISGGSLKQRVDTILQLCKTVPAIKENLGQESVP